MEQSPTGRLSSKGPNIQNISPKTEEFRKIKAAFTELPKCSYEVQSGFGTWQHRIYRVAPLGTVVAYWDIGYTIGMDGTDVEPIEAA